MLTKEATGSMLCEYSLWSTFDMRWWEECVNATDHMLCQVQRHLHHLC